MNKIVMTTFLDLNYDILVNLFTQFVHVSDMSKLAATCSTLASITNDKYVRCKIDKRVKKGYLKDCLYNGLVRKAQYIKVIDFSVCGRGLWLLEIRLPHEKSYNVFYDSDDIEHSINVYFNDGGTCQLIEELQL